MLMKKLRSRRNMDGMLNNCGWSFSTGQYSKNPVLVVYDRPLPFLKKTETNWFLLFFQSLVLIEEVAENIHTRLIFLLFVLLGCRHCSPNIFLFVAGSCHDILGKEGVVSFRCLLHALKMHCLLSVWLDVTEGCLERSN